MCPWGRDAAKCFKLCVKLRPTRPTRSRRLGQLPIDVEPRFFCPDPLISCSPGRERLPGLRVCRRGLPTAVNNSN
jgi:hypothetical protein